MGSVAIAAVQLHLTTLSNTHSQHVRHLNLFYKVGKHEQLMLLFYKLHTAWLAGSMECSDVIQLSHTLVPHGTDAGSKEELYSAK